MNRIREQRPTHKLWCLPTALLPFGFTIPNKRYTHNDLKSLVNSFDIELYIDVAYGKIAMYSPINPPKAHFVLRVAPNLQHVFQVDRANRSMFEGLLENADTVDYISQLNLGSETIIKVESTNDNKDKKKKKKNKKKNLARTKKVVVPEIVTIEGNTQVVKKNKHPISLMQGSVVTKKNVARHRVAYVHGDKTSKSNAYWAQNLIHQIINPCDYYNSGRIIPWPGMVDFVNLGSSIKLQQLNPINIDSGTGTVRSYTALIDPGFVNCAIMYNTSVLRSKAIYTLSDLTRNGNILSPTLDSMVTVSNRTFNGTSDYNQYVIPMFSAVNMVVPTNTDQGDLIASSANLMTPSPFFKRDGSILNDQAELSFERTNNLPNYIPLHGVTPDPGQPLYLKLHVEFNQRTAGSTLVVYVHYIRLSDETVNDSVITSVPFTGGEDVYDNLIPLLNDSTPALPIVGALGAIRLSFSGTDRTEIGKLTAELVNQFGDTQLCNQTPYSHFVGIPAPDFSFYNSKIQRHTPFCSSMLVTDISNEFSKNGNISLFRVDNGAAPGEANLFLGAPSNLFLKESTGFYAASYKKQTSSNSFNSPNEAIDLARPIKFLGSYNYARIEYQIQTTSTIATPVKLMLQAYFIHSIKFADNETFIPMKNESNDEVIRAVDLILNKQSIFSENPFHLSSIFDFLKKSANKVSSVFGSIAPALMMGAAATGNPLIAENIGKASQVNDLVFGRQ